MDNTEICASIISRIDDISIASKENTIPYDILKLHYSSLTNQGKAFDSNQIKSTFFDKAERVYLFSL
jgi:hypothetical protein